MPEDSGKTKPDPAARPPAPGPRHHAPPCAPCRPGRPRSGACRVAILHATLEVVEELGFASATIEAIADRAQVGKATIYRWWPDKAHVVIDALLETTSPSIPFPNTGYVQTD